MKKKIVLLSIAAALVSITVFGTTIAWFMDTDEATNIFTVGSVDIVQHEKFDETTAMLLPVLGTDPTVESDHYIQKAVTVENVGRNEAYVQTYVAVPAVLDNNGILKLYDGELSAKGWIRIDGDTTTDGIQPVATDITIDGETIPYNAYLYRYDTELAINTETAACLEYVYIDSSMDLNPYDLFSGDGQSGKDGIVDTAYFVLPDNTEITGFNAVGELNIYVTTVGVQKEPFANAEEAFATVFPTHPWAAD